MIVGQKHLVESLLIGLLSDGHILLEGVPGLAKTLAINTLADAVDAKFSRIQFTPDLLPADLTGTLISARRTKSSPSKLGPVFANFVLADESTAPRPRCSPPCSKPCRNIRSPSAIRPTPARALFW